MPVELIRMILAGVPDVRSLHSAIVSCPLFYLTFLDVESEITPQVLLNQIDETVLPEALAALETFALLDISRPFYGGTEWHESKGIALKSRDISCRPTSLRGTIRLSQLHENVRYFADIFIDRNLSVGPLNRVHKPITHQERCRIERAFYRFDIYCAYFRPPLPADRSGRVMASRYLSPLGPFQEQFTPWEMEQLSCICHFMARELLRPFNDVAEHDIEWCGSHNIEYGTVLRLPKLQVSLSMGLQNMRKMVQADTYEQRYALMGRAATDPTPSIWMLGP